jgi:hypothetical protein
MFRNMMKLRGVEDTPFGEAIRGVVEDSDENPVYTVLFSSYKKLRFIGEKVPLFLSISIFSIYIFVVSFHFLF